jgi:hypothetical protein
VVTKVPAEGSLLGEGSQGYMVGEGGVGLEVGIICFSIVIWGLFLELHRI